MMGEMNKKFGAKGYAMVGIMDPTAAGQICNYMLVALSIKSYCLLTSQGSFNFGKTEDGNKQTFSAYYEQSPELKEKFLEWLQRAFRESSPFSLLTSSIDDQLTAAELRAKVALNPSVLAKELIDVQNDSVDVAAAQTIHEEGGGTSTQKKKVISSELVGDTDSDGSLIGEEDEQMDWESPSHKKPTRKVKAKPRPKPSKYELERERNIRRNQRLLQREAVKASMVFATNASAREVVESSDEESSDENLGGEHSDGADEMVEEELVDEEMGEVTEGEEISAKEMAAREKSKMLREKLKDSVRGTVRRTTRRPRPVIRSSEQTVMDDALGGSGSGHDEPGAITGHEDLTPANEISASRQKGMSPVGNTPALPAESPSAGTLVDKSATTVVPVSNASHCEQQDMQNADAAPVTQPTQPSTSSIEHALSETVNAEVVEGQAGVLDGLMEDTEDEEPQQSKVAPKGSARRPLRGGARRARKATGKGAAGDGTNHAAARGEVMVVQAWYVELDKMAQVAFRNREDRGAAVVRLVKLLDCARGYPPNLVRTSGCFSCASLHLNSSQSICRIHRTSCLLPSVPSTSRSGSNTGERLTPPAGRTCPPSVRTSTHGLRGGSPSSQRSEELLGHSFVMSKIRAVAAGSI